MAKQGAKTVVPRLRFPEFRDAAGWEWKTLSHACDMQAGKFISASEISEKPYEGTYPCYGGNGLRGYTTTFTHSGRYSLIGRQGALCGNIKFAKGDFYATEHALVSTPKSGIHVDWLFYALKGLELNRFATGQAQPGLSVDILKGVPCTVPRDEVEQKKIADCLTSLDEVIAAQGRKVEALKAHKRGLMQQLFPREGETRPRLRFPEFCDAPEWKSTPLGGIAEIKLGKMLDAKKHKSGHLLPYVNNISLRWNEVVLSDLPQMHFKDSELERYGLRKGDVLVCEGGEPGRSAVWDGSMLDLKFQKAVHRVRFRVPFVPKMLVIYLEAIAGTTAFESLFTGGGIKHLTGETFAKLAIPVMSLPEQQRIADCLSSLDTRIIAESAHLAALKTHEQGLMQQLFPMPGAD